MANIVTRYEIMSLLEKGCIHSHRGLCPSCLQDVRAWVLNIPQNTYTQ